MNDFRIAQDHPTIDKMVETNEWDYNIDKTIEELLELAEVLMKRKLKGNSEFAPKKQAIIDEIGDVEIRIRVLRKLLGEEAIDKRIEEKLAKFEGFYKEGKYIGRI